MPVLEKVPNGNVPVTIVKCVKVFCAVCEQPDIIGQGPCTRDGAQDRIESHSLIRPAEVVDYLYHVPSSPVRTIVLNAS